MKIYKGIYPQCAKMPCSPEDIIILESYNFLHPETFGSVGSTLLAALIISFSQDFNCWVGATWPLINRRIKEGSENRPRAEAVYQLNQRERQRYFRERLKFIPLFLLTLGKKKKPQKQSLEMPRFISLSEDEIAAGLHELMQEKLIREERRAEDIVFFPTPDLVIHLLEKQEEWMNRKQAAV